MHFIASRLAQLRQLFPRGANRVPLLKYNLNSMTTPSAIPERAHEVLSYWLGPDYAEPKPAGFWPPGDQTKLWFRGGPEVDEHVKQTFAGDVDTLAAGGYHDWLTKPVAAVAGIIMADQFTRNLYRGTAQAFSLDDKALQWSHHVRTACDLKSELPSAALRYFSYMPLMHSEVLQDQELLVQLVEEEADAAKQSDPESAAAKSWLEVKRFAEAHRDVVARWGRFPHRNALVGRASTPEEEAGLQDGSIPRW